MKKTGSIILLLAVLSSCDEQNDFIGEWHIDNTPFYDEIISVTKSDRRIIFSIDRESYFTIHSPFKDKLLIHRKFMHGCFAYDLTYDAALSSNKDTLTVSVYQNYQSNNYTLNKYRHPIKPIKLIYTRK